jgi:spore germination protein Q
MPSGSIIPGVAPGFGGVSPQAGPPGFRPSMLPMEQSFIENILRLNRGKVATVYTTYENNREWNALVFRGVIEEAGRDHLILSDPETGESYLLRMINLDYVTFTEPINYIPFTFPGGQAQQPFLTTAPPR